MTWPDDHYPIPDARYWQEEAERWKKEYHALRFKVSNAIWRLEGRGRGSKQQIAERLKNSIET